MRSFFTFLILIFISISSAMATDPPGLELPADSSMTFAEVQFQWSADSTAVAYEFQADSTVSFNSPILVETTIISVSPGSDNTIVYYQLHFGVDYFWRVRTITSLDTSAWSNSFHFTTRDSIVINSPLLNSEHESRVKLDWDAYPGANYYDVQYDTVSSFNSPILQSSFTTAFTSQNTSFDTELSIIHLYFGQAYYWRIRARNDVDSTVWSQSQFYTKDSVLLNTNNGSTHDVGTKLNWYAYENVQFYDFQLDSDPGFGSTSLISAEKAYINNNDGNSDTEYIPSDLLFDTYYYWRARARHYADTSQWSTDSFHTYSTVDLNTPLNLDVVDVQLTIDWQPHTGIDYYVYQVDIVDQFNSPQLIQGQKIYINEFDGNSDTRAEIYNLKFGTSYYWRVRAVNGSDESAWSEVRLFTTVDSVDLMYPLDNTSNFTQIDFSWAEIEGILKYQIQVDTLLGFSSNLLVQYNTGLSSNKVIPNLSFGKNYYWRVRAISAVDTTAWSDYRTFYTYDLPGLYTPDQGALSVDTAVMLDWMHHTGAVMYHLEVDTSNTYSTGWLIQSNQIYLGPSSGLSDTEYNLSGLEEDQYYFWRVRVLNEKDTSQWENRWFSTGNNPLILPEIPSLIAPLHHEINVSVNPDLLWAAVTGAAGYYYQVSKDMDFSNDPILMAISNQVALSNLDYVDDYYWRVRTFDGNLVSDWSAVFHFTTTQEKLQAPDLITPLNGVYSQSVTQLTFDWTNVYHADYYVIEISTSDNFLFDLIQEQVNSSILLVNALLPGNNYFWRVRAMNDTLIHSEWSDVWTFSTLQVLDAPQLTSPYNTAAEQVYNNLMLEWTEVTLADAYEIEYAKDEYFLVNPVHEVNVVNYFIVSTLDPGSIYYWRVRAVADTMYQSDWSYVWTFTTREMTGIESLESSQVKAYPNPVRDIVYIESDQSLGKIEILTIEGRKIYVDRVLDKNFSIDMSGYPGGVYYLRRENQELIRLIKLD